MHLRWHGANAEAAIQAALDYEVSRAQAAESSLQAALNYEESARAGAITEVRGITTYLEGRVNTLSDDQRKSKEVRHRSRGEPSNPDFGIAIKY